MNVTDYGEYTITSLLPFLIFSRVYLPGEVSSDAGPGFLLSSVV